MKTQKGFTLIELMIALVLGLIIVAAAVGIYIANYKTLATQKSSSEMQSASMFGIQPLESRLRLANLGNGQTTINDTIADAGIIIDARNLGSVSIDPKFLSKSNIGDSNIDGKKSDQLTVQFSNSTPFKMYDCEGQEIAVNAKVIERYFLRAKSGGSFALICDAGSISGSSVSGLDDNGGVELVADVDQFKFLLGTQRLAFVKDSGSGAKEGDVVTAFYTTDEYAKLNVTNDKGLLQPKPAIVSIKSAIIARGSTPMSTSDGLSEFILFGNDVHNLKSSVSKQFSRNTFETTTLLRNARSVTFTAATNEVLKEKNN